jgi:hypothetical protein
MGEFEEEQIAEAPEDGQPAPFDPVEEPVAREDDVPQGDSEPEAEVDPVTDVPEELFPADAEIALADSEPAGEQRAEVPDVAAADEPAASEAPAAEDAAAANQELPTGEGPEEGEEPPASEEPAEEEVPPSDEDIAAAVAAAADQVGTEATLDDIAPATVHANGEAAPPEEIAAKYGAPWWPFLVYLCLWIVFAALAVWKFQQLPAGAPVYEAEQYALFVFGGLVLAGTGVFLIPMVWLVARTSPKRHRAGLFSSAFIKGAAMILLGVVIWWGTIMALDYLRLGRFL